VETEGDMGCVSVEERSGATEGEDGRPIREEGKGGGDRQGEYG